MEEHTNHIDRRDFFKIVGITAAATTTSFVGCSPQKENTPQSTQLGPVPTDKMTYRTTPTTKDKVSILG